MQNYASISQNIRRLPGICAMIILGAIALQGETFSITSVFFTRGSGYHDASLGVNTDDGVIDRISIQHFGGWKYGDNFFFINFDRGRFLDLNDEITEDDHAIYAEWTTRLSLDRLLGLDWQNRFIKGLYLAYEMDRGGDGFTGDLFGIGLDINIPSIPVLSFNLFYRMADFSEDAMQLTSIWLAPIPVGPLVFIFDGYLDIYHTEAGGIDILSQPNLRLPLHTIFSEKWKDISIGIQAFIHTNNTVDMFVPQLLFRWDW